MKLLADSCISKTAVQFLRNHGFEVQWIVEWQKDPGDQEILKYALETTAIVITQDKDFGELAIVHGKEHTGIIRLINIATSQQGPTCKYILNKHADALKEQAIITASSYRIRIRFPDKSE